MKEKLETIMPAKKFVLTDGSYFVKIGGFTEVLGEAYLFESFETASLVLDKLENKEKFSIKKAHVLINF